MPDGLPETVVGLANGSGPLRLTAVVGDDRLTDTFGAFCVVGLPDPRYVAVGSSHWFVRVWDTENGSCLRGIRGEIKSTVEDLGLLPDGRLAVATGDGDAFVVDVGG